MNLVVSLFMFFFSFHNSSKTLPEHHRTLAIRFSFVVIACMTIGAGLIGMLVGAKFGPDQGGIFVGAVGFATAGFSTGLSLSLYRILNFPAAEDPSSRKSEMSFFTATTIPVLAWVGLIAGMIVGWNMNDVSEGAMLPMVFSLLGSLLGAILGAIFEHAVKQSNKEK